MYLITYKSWTIQVSEKIQIQRAAYNSILFVGIVQNEQIQRGKVD